MTTSSTTSSSSSPSSFELFETHDLPHQQSLSWWTEQWWKWILQTPASKNPGYGYSDSEKPSMNQQPYDKEDVWFLAGAFNDGSLPHTRNVSFRSVMLPQGKALLMPVINFFGVVRKTKHIPELVKRVKEEMDVINPESLYVTINKQQVDSRTLMKYRADTARPFEISVDGKDNVLRMKHLLGKNIDVFAKADGYWLFLKPLPAGEHEIHSFGSCLQGKIQIEIHYKINVLDD